MSLCDHKLASLLRDGPAVIVVLDPAFRVKQISENVKNLTGWGANAYQGRTDLWLKTIHKDDLPSILQWLEESSVVSQKTLEFRATCANGSTIWVKARMKFQMEENEVIAYMTDVTEDVRRQQHLEFQTKRLKEVNDSLEQFVFTASHELREPLSGIAGFATLIQKRYAHLLDDQGKHYLEEVIEGTKCTATKLDDLLDLARVSQVHPNGPFPLADAINDAHRSLAGIFMQTNGVLIIDQELPIVRGDRRQIAQIFQNLFSNSLKYRKSGQAPQIQVSVKPYNGTRWLITVKDQGLGFDPIHKEKIFGVFQRLYTIEQYPGTGIGLAIVKKIVERHGGEIWAESEPGKGASFHFSLLRGEDLT